MGIATQTDVGGPGEWQIDDPVIRLRMWATGISHPLPASRTVLTLGAADGCWLRLRDPTGRVSRHHAKLVYDDGRWTVFDARSKNGTFMDGARRASFPLAPGVELGIGGITLIAESDLLSELRELLARLIGWADERRGAVDLALRAMRLAATGREALLLSGQGDLVSIAQLLHRHTLGNERPFVVCDPRRIRADPNARSAANYNAGLAALSAAAGGTLCVWQSRQPADFDRVVTARKDPSCRVQLVVCTHTLQPGDPLIAEPIALPPLSERTKELNQIIDSYERDAIAEFGSGLMPSDRDSIRRNESANISQIQKATRRLVAIRSADGSITRAAHQLGMSHSALSEWLARRAILGIDDDKQP